MWSIQSSKDACALTSTRKISVVWDMNDDRSGDSLFLRINKTVYLMAEDRISMAE
jgi:hypothetical protein